MKKIVEKEQSTNGPIEDFCNVVDTLKTMSTSIIQCKPIYNNKDMKAILGISDKLLMKYRNDGLLSFSQVGEKFWYTQKDLEEFIKHNAQMAYTYTNYNK